MVDFNAGLKFGIKCFGCPDRAMGKCEGYRPAPPTLFDTRYINNKPYSAWGLGCHAISRQGIVLRVVVVQDPSVNPIAQPYTLKDLESDFKFYTSSEKGDLVLAVSSNHLPRELADAIGGKYSGRVFFVVFCSFIRKAGKWDPGFTIRRQPVSMQPNQEWFFQDFLPVGVDVVFINARDERGGFLSVETLSANFAGLYKELNELGKAY